MKKILLGTTTLVGAAMLFAGAANADGPKVTVGGYADFQLGNVSEDNDTNLRSHAFFSDTEVTFRVDGKSDNGLGYGGGVDLNADTTADNQADGGNASRTFVYLDGTWGRFEMGSDVGAQGTMKVDASNIASGSGGVDGDFYRYMTAAATTVIASPDLVLAYGAGTMGNESQENLNKVTYYTPRFSGLQAGVSYTVNNDDRGQTITRADNNSGDFESIWSGGLSYEGNFEDVGITLAATGEFGDAESTTQEDLAAWNIGTLVTFQSFSFAASYGDWGDSGRTTGTSNDEADYWTVGAAYEHGPFGLSVTYLDSDYEVAVNNTSEFTNLSVGADYKLAPGLTPYAEVSFVDVDLTGTANDNDATIAIVGTQLNF